MLGSWSSGFTTRRDGTPRGPHAARALRFPLLVASLLLLTAQATGQTGNPYLNELLADNETVLADEDSEFSDWIEIHNDSPFALDLSGWHLTDDALDLLKWTFPTTVLPPDGYLVVFASDKDRAVAGAELHTNFKLKAAGEYLALVEPDGITVAHAYDPAFPMQSADVSFGLDEVAATHAYFDPPSPGAPNGSGLQYVDRVEFSHSRGFHDDPFALALSVSTPGASIRYTLDGSLPTEAAGTLYTTPLAVADTTIVRARAFLNGFASDAAVTHTYLFEDDVLAQTHAGAVAAGYPAAWIDKDGVDWTAANGGTHPGALYGLHPDILALSTQEELRAMLRAAPSLSLVMARDDWFAYQPPSGPFGLYVNSTQPWERGISMEWIEPDGDAVQLDCGIEVQGSSSSSPEWRSQLSFQLKFTKEHGPAEFDYPVFADSSVESFDTLILDSGNQYSINGKGGDTTKVHDQELRDPFVSDLQTAMGGLSVHTRKVHVYLNGLYWGLYNLHERSDENFGAAYGGGDDAEYDWVKQGVVLEGNSNSLTNPNPGAWKIATDIRQHGVAPGVTYGAEPAYDALAAIFDVSGYADYMLANFYAGTGDWPQNNWMATSHSRLSADFGDTNPDGRFLFHVWDAEVCLPWGPGVTDVGGGADNTLVSSTSGANVACWITALRAHPDFLMLIADRAHEHLAAGGALWVDPDHDEIGTPYDPSHPGSNRPAALYQRLVDDAVGGIALEYARWGNYWIHDNHWFFTPADWLAEKDRLLNDFFPIRSGVLEARLQNAGYLPELDAPSFSCDGGGVPVGWGLSMQGPAGAIRYTLDGSDPRLPLGAVNPAAQVYKTPITLTTPVTVKARALVGGTWSPLTRATFAVGTELVLNEFMAANETFVQDESGDYDDWVEVYNAGPLPVDMGGMTLTDDLLDPAKWAAPAGVVVPAGGSVILWADEDGGQGPRHMNFKLSAQGEALALFGSPAMGGGRLDAVLFGPQAVDVSHAREIDGVGPWAVQPNPTPGLPNGPTTCQTDLGHHGPGSGTLSVCGGDLSNGTSANLQIVGGLPGAPAWLVLGLGALPTPVKFGSLVPVPWLILLPVALDAGGAFTLAAIPGGLGPFSLYVQAIYVDAAQPKGYGFTNAVAMDFLP